jgi:Zn-dependent peptidase ImmA (M78 family)/DNA-binding XRE family transcriptional regulator
MSSFRHVGTRAWVADNSEVDNRRIMFCPRRLALARQRRRLTQAALAGRIGLPARRVGDYERGQAEPRPEVLSSLSATLKFPLGFFGFPEPDEVAVGAVSFRAPGKMVAADQNAALSGVVLASEFNRWIETRFELAEPAVPVLERTGPQLAAEMVRAHWRIDLKPISNMVHLVEAHGMRVFALAPEDARVGSFSLWHGGLPFIFLDTSTPGVCGRFDVAHELGHLVLHSGSAKLPSPEAEEEADAFARGFLMPGTSVFAHMPRGPLTSHILEGTDIWGVSAMTLAHRLHELGLLTEEQHRVACVQLSKCASRDASELLREDSQLLTKVLRSLRSQGISLADIAAELCIPLEELAKIMFGLTITGVPGTGSVDFRECAGTDEKPRLGLVTPK